MFTTSQSHFALQFPVLQHVKSPSRLAPIIPDKWQVPLESSIATRAQQREIQTLSKWAPSICSTTSVFTRVWQTCSPHQSPDATARQAALQICAWPLDAPWDCASSTTQSAPPPAGPLNAPGWTAILAEEEQWQRRVTSSA